MSNLAWFLSLVFISVLIILFTYKKDDSRKNIAVYFFIVGLSFLMEFIVLVLLNAYSYYPHLFSEQWFDNVFGSSISQAFFIPSVLTAIAALQLRTRGVLLIIAVIFLIEELFLWLGIYEHHWWKSSYTAILLFIASFVVKWWRRRIDHSPIFVRFLTIYMLITAITHAVSFYLSTIFKFQWYTVGWFSSPVQDHLAFNVLLLFIYTIIMTVIVLFSYNTFSFISLFIGDILIKSWMIKIGILHVVDYFILLPSALVLVIVVFMVKKISLYLFST